MVAILITSAKYATLNLLKVRVFGKKEYGVIISVQDITNEIISHHSSNIADAIIWPKSGNCSISLREVTITSILKRFNPKKRDALGASSIIWVALAMVSRIQTSVAKNWKLTVNKFWRLIFTFLEVTAEKLEVRAFSTTHPNNPERK